MSIDLVKLEKQYKNELLENIIPFWLNKSPDKEFGGYFTCLNRKGEVFDTDKFIWLQARQVWMFAKLYNEVEKRPEWLNCAIQGAEFLKKHGHDGNYNWYFSTNCQGEPLMEPYNIFSYTFAAMAFGQLHLATENPVYAQIAKETIKQIQLREENPKSKWNKAHQGTRDLKNFALPMILSNLSLEVQHLIDKEFLEKSVNKCIDEIMNEFRRPELGGLIVENVNADGSLSDSFEGRLINPGHGIEAMWFIMDLGERMNRPELIDKAVETTIATIEYGWDKQCGGI